MNKLPDVTNGNGEKIRKILFNEISFIVSIATIVITMILFITKPVYKINTQIALIQKDISIINTNHLHTIEAYIKDINAKDDDQDKMINEIKIQLAEILALLRK